MTQVVEDAVQAYRPPPPAQLPPLPEGFEYRNGLIVQVSRSTSMEEILGAIEDGRNRPLFYDEDEPLD